MSKSNKHRNDWDDEVTHLVMNKIILTIKAVNAEDARQAAAKNEAAEAVVIEKAEVLKS